MKKVKQKEKIPSQYGSEIKPDFLKAMTIKMPLSKTHEEIFGQVGSGMTHSVLMPYIKEIQSSGTLDSLLKKEHILVIPKQQ